MTAKYFKTLLSLLIMSDEKARPLKRYRFQNDFQSIDHNKILGDARERFFKSKEDAEKAKRDIAQAEADLASATAIYAHTKREYDQICGEAQKDIIANNQALSDIAAASHNVYMAKMVGKFNTLLDELPPVGKKLRLHSMNKKNYCFATVISHDMNKTQYISPTMPIPRPFITVEIKDGIKINMQYVQAYNIWRGDKWEYKVPSASSGSSASASSASASSASYAVVTRIASSASSGGTSVSESAPSESASSASESAKKA